MGRQGRKGLGPLVFDAEDVDEEQGEVDAHHREGIVGLDVLPLSGDHPLSLIGIGLAEISHAPQGQHAGVLGVESRVRLLPASLLPLHGLPHERTPWRQ
jgi:hypothetical protein